MTTTNNNKSLEKILSRDDYHRLTESLKERVQAIAKRIHAKMDELDIPDDSDFDDGEISAGNVVVCIKRVHTHSCGAYEFLAIKREFEGEWVQWASLEDVGRDYYYAGDFNARVRGANNKEALAFLNVASKLIEGLGEVEEKNIAAVSETLRKTENI